MDGSISLIGFEKKTAARKKFLITPRCESALKNCREEMMVVLFQISACAVLLVFYGIYFTKLLAQKKCGIRTHQIGTRKEKGLHTVEVLMSVATLCIVPVQLLSILFHWSLLPDNARFTGFLTGMLGDGIFLIAVLTMKDSWRAGIPEKDQTEFVSSGIYAFSRNPAFLGFDFMYIGMCLLFCNPLSIAFTLFTITMLHLQILQEEPYLEYTFGEAYLNYKKRVFRYLGRKNGSVLNFSDSEGRKNQ